MQYADQGKPTRGRGPVYCGSCDYNLGGLAAGPCPECATPFDPTDPTTYLDWPRHQLNSRRRAAGIILGVLTCLVVALGVSAQALLMLVFAIGCCGILGVLVGMQPRRSAYSRTLSCIAAAPACAMLGFFYSLAIHMHRELGGWPSRLGTSGFSTQLKSHADFAFGSFTILLLTNILAVPVALAVCSAVPRWRRFCFPLGVCGISFCIAFAGMLAAPSPFLNWWWD